MILNIKMVLQEVINKYNLEGISTLDGWLYCESQKAIYELKESRKLVNIEL